MINVTPSRDDSIRRSRQCICVRLRFFRTGSVRSRHLPLALSAVVLWGDLSVALLHRDSVEMRRELVLAGLAECKTIDSEVWAHDEVRRIAGRTGFEIFRAPTQRRSPEDESMTVAPGDVLFLRRRSQRGFSVRADASRRGRPRV